ncbi:Fungal trans [Geosmithia morbida]|uniref:Fungal trans n=1 Tax=Geosmithia morbida TaxID=1094350 RepID=A0A9P4YXM1_9HYPO|nr:Fungal trans [Geosmithia morbida]KAF4123925.1 Fungal trans [Geosmithia morbida]
MDRFPSSPFNQAIRHTLIDPGRTNKVRALEAQLAQYVDDDDTDARSPEDMIRPGGMVRLGAEDETPRYLGPSSGIAMTRLLMEEAKRFSQSNRVADLIPDLETRRRNRMQSIQMTAANNYPTMSGEPAEELPRRDTATKLVEIYKHKGEDTSQVLWPILHEPSLEKDVDDVYKGDKDVYKRFVTNMVFAIALQRMSIRYAGLADAFYLAAMKNFEAVLRPKDLKTLQCLALIGQYSLITPTRAPVYYVIGLAARICQQEGLVDETTITAGYNLDPLTLDLRRRVVWNLASLEYGLSHTLGRPNIFATSDEKLDVRFLSAMPDQYITENGIRPGPESEDKLVAIHAFKLRIHQAEIRRTLYERKRPEPENDSSPWHQEMERQLEGWLNEGPSSPLWCRIWFVGCYHQNLIFIYRPSPQIPKPSSRAAEICFNSAANIINLSYKQTDEVSVSITWVFLLTLNMSLTTLLWSMSYPEVRSVHSREEAEALVNKALEIIETCEKRWPGSGNSSELFSILSKACIQSYESAGYQPNMVFNTSSSSEGGSSPDASSQSQAGSNTGSTRQTPQPPQPPQPPQYLNPPQFGSVFGSSPESINSYTLEQSFPHPQPTFRSNSIFQSPSATDTHGRRFSYFPPEFNIDEVPDPGDPGAQPSPPPVPNQQQSFVNSRNQAPPNQMPGPLDPMDVSSSPSNMTSPPHVPHQQQPMPSSGPPPPPQDTMGGSMPPHPKINHVAPQAAQRVPPYTMPPQLRQQPQQQQQQHHPSPQQSPSVTIPQTDWFSNSAAFVMPYPGPMGNSNGFYDEMMPEGGSGIGSGMVGGSFGDFPMTQGFGLETVGANAALGSQQFGRAMMPGRQDSLTQSQQLELMNSLETESFGDFDAYLKPEDNSTGLNTGWY